MEERKSVCREGQILQRDGSRLQVQIGLATACAGCAVQGVCKTFDGQAALRTLWARWERPESPPEPGESVTVAMAQSEGFRAVWWAFVWPWAVLMGVLVVGLNLGWPPTLTLAAALASLVPSYALVAWRSPRWSQRLEFIARRPLC